MQPGRARTSSLGVPLLPLARWVGWVAPVGPTHGVLVLSCPPAALRVCGVLGLPAPVHRCARSVCCVGCAVSWASRLLFTGVPARCGVLRVRCPGPPGFCSPVCPLGVLCCVCGVLGPPAPVHRCAHLVCCVACAVSWASRLLFTGVPARCVVLGVRCPGPPGSCSPVCPLGVLCCVCAVSWASWLLFTGVPARCVVLRLRCPGPPGSCSPVCPLGVLCCVCGVLGLPAPVPPPKILAAVFSQNSNHAFSEPRYQTVHSSTVVFMFSQIFIKIVLSLKLEPQINCQQLPRTRVSDSRSPCAIENRQEVHFFSQLEAK